MRNFSVTNSINPITPTGAGKYTVYNYPMTRGISYTWSDWSFAQKNLIDSSLGMNWATLITWCQQHNYLMRILPEKAIFPVISKEFYIQNEDGEINELATNTICKGSFIKDILKVCFVV